MKYNFKLVVIVSILVAVISSLILKVCGESLGIPPDWNAAIVGGLAGGISSIVGQKYASKTLDD